MAGTAFLHRFRHSEQLCILAQATDHGYAVFSQWFDERSIGICSIDDDPDCFLRGFGHFREFEHLLRRQLQLRTEPPFVSARDVGNVFRAYIHQSQQRQPDGMPKRMANHQGNCHPNMAIQILLAGRARCGIAVNASSLHLRAVTLGRRVVYCKQHTLACHEPRQQQRQQPSREMFGLASQGLQEVIISGIVVLDTRRSEPRCNGPSAASKQDACNDQRQPPPVLTMQSGGQPIDPLLPFHRRLILNHPWLSHCAVCLTTAA